MPCRDDYPVRSEPTVSQKDFDAVRSRLDKVTNLLCKLCKLAGVDERFSVDSDIYQWYQNHKAEDAKRKEAELHEMERKRAAILNKLTAEERQILGVK